VEFGVGVDGEVVMGDCRWTLEMALGTGNEQQLLRKIGRLTGALLDVVWERGEAVEFGEGEDGEVVMGDCRSTLQMALGIGNERQTFRQFRTLTGVLLDVVSDCGELAVCGFG
jgi:hypothetical protein